MKAHEVFCLFPSVDCTMRVKRAPCFYWLPGFVCQKELQATVLMLEYMVHALCRLPQDLPGHEDLMIR